MPTANKHHPPSVRKVALRDLHNETRNIIVRPQGTSLTKQRRPFSEAVNVSGAKRHHPDCPPSPRHPSESSAVANSELVYARRKLEEMRSLSSSDPEATVVSPVSGRSTSIEAKEPGRPQDPSQQPGVSRFQDSSPVPEASPDISSLGPSVVFSPTSQVYWKDRFLMLQKFLNQCDQSSQEEYIQMLRSTSAAGRSRHAVDLEKRAIHLLLEEGKELRRMKLLNVLGKLSPE
ncbi:unnamed protein product [Spirodela intermedia]|uniref:Uncharacterized protein n=2 Tax=Spirodela intermedia TaxID=51605 RepID=A0A7I8K470_SPIIN|nr:unnamed protein product [Spirodela intermedia]CAA6655869.1 unnamed protein product [Spirodela intermedia]CAA7391254.1 unnamed protein product [Spirodela intermedia]